MNNNTIKPGYAHVGKHNPTGEEWYLLGIDTKGDRVCAAGWPPTIAKLSEMEGIYPLDLLSEDELRHRHNTFGDNWDNPPRGDAGAE